MSNDVAQNAVPALAGGDQARLPPWSVLLIEDNLETIRQIREHFERREIDGRSLAFQVISNWGKAFGLIREHKADLVILDIYRGQAASGGERIGERVLDDIKRSGFVPVIIHTNLAEGLENLRSAFVRLVPKTEGLDRLREEMEGMFQTHIPQMHRAIVNHLDRALCQYMWGFVTEQWTNLSGLADRPEFLRLLLHRLAISFMREGVDTTVSEVFPDYEGSGLDPETAHPAEFYVKPPISEDPALGDIRLREVAGNREYLVVLWPTCDMVSTGKRKTKTDIVICAKGTLLETFPEAKEYAENQSSKRRDALCELLKNNRKRDSPEKVHFLPGFLDIPDLVVDFQALEVQQLNSVKALACLGTLASPFAEHLGSRFVRYLGRIGTRDLALVYVLKELVNATPAAEKSETEE